MERGRWDALFADLEAELDGEEARELDAEVRDRTQAERARLALADRLAAHRGAQVSVITHGAGTITGRLDDAAPNWLVVGGVLVPRTAILGVRGLGPGAVEPDARPRARLSMGYALRAMAGEVVCTFVDGRTLRATIERVGKDHVDLDGEAVPFRAIAAIRPA